MNKRKINSKSTKIFIATPEISALPIDIDPHNIIKTTGGGLGRATSSLGLTAFENGIDVHFVIPGYEQFFLNNSNLSTSDFYEQWDEIKLHPNVHIIEDGLFEGAKKVYGDNSFGISKMDVRRSICLSKGILSKLTDFRTYFDDCDILVELNDWTTALCAPAIKNYGERYNLKTILKFHNSHSNTETLRNLFKSGINVSRYHKTLFYETDFPSDSFEYDMNERNLRVNFLASGLLSSDAIQTVSSQYLEEIINGRMRSLGEDILSEKLEHVIRTKYFENKAFSCLNAPESYANPEFDNLIFEKYNSSSLINGKLANKKELLKQFNMKGTNGPIIFWPHRLVEPQKGIELYLNSCISILNKYENVKLIFVADGENKFVDRINALKNNFKDRVGYSSFNSKLSALGTAGSDFLMMPSRYEPCGYPQLEAPNYGTLPIVMNTGGLSLIKDYYKDPLDFTGFVFNDFDKNALLWAVDQAMTFYKKPLSEKEKLLINAREFNLKTNNTQTMLKNHIDIWENVIGNEIIY